MTLDEFRSDMVNYWRSVDAEAATKKDSSLAYDRLCRLYRRFDEVERRMANEVLAEWALAEEDGLQFDALALISEFKIRSAIPSLRILAERLPTVATPSAPYQLKKVLRIIQELL